MKKLTEEQIAKINGELAWKSQGISPSNNEDIDQIAYELDCFEPLVFQKYNTGGATGGGYHENDELRSYYNYDIPDFDALKMVLDILFPDGVEMERINYLVQTKFISGYADYYVDILPRINSGDSSRPRHLSAPRVNWFLGSQNFWDVSTQTFAHVVFKVEKTCPASIFLFKNYHSFCQNIFCSVMVSFMLCSTV
jgi:hypothetical protein